MTDIQMIWQNLDSYSSKFSSCPGTTNMKPNKQIDQINQMKRRNPVLAIALARKAGPMRDRRQRRVKERTRRELQIQYSDQ